jgi:hypothetical protein
MVWPTTKAPQGFRVGRTLDRTFLGKFYHGNVEIDNLWKQNPKEIFKILKTLTSWEDLPDEVLEKYSNASFDDVKRIVLLWRGIEANFIACNTKLLCSAPCNLHRRLFRWCVTNGIHSYDATSKAWKKITLHILHFCNKVSWDENNPMPIGVPGTVNGTIGPDWFEMLPALQHFNIGKLCGDMSCVPISAYDDIGHLIQSRMTPPPPLTEARFETEYLELKRQFTRQSAFTAEMAQELDQALRRFGNYLEKTEWTARPHISLSGSGSYENSRTSGGRAIYVQERFIRLYVQQPATRNVVDKTIWGAPYVLKRGIKPYRTMCREHSLVEDVNFLHSAFREETAPGGLLAAIFSDVNAHESLEEPMFGLDKEFPHQILQLCVEEAVEKGYIPGPITYGVRDPTFSQRTIPTEVVLQPEGGNKIRGLSKAPACVTVILQPFAHFLAGLVGRYPTLRSAFSRSYKGWDLAVKLMRQKDNYIEPNSGFSVIDLVGSTNGFDWELVRRVLNHLVVRFARNHYEIAYFSICIGLLIAPRCMKIRKNQKSPYHRVIVTERGVHMGDPGSKETLCVIQALIELMVYSDVPKPPPSLIAGDDHGAARTYDRHRKLIAKHMEYGNEIQETKAQWSQQFVLFCEEMLVWVPEAINRGIPPWKLPPDEDHLNLHRDIIKMRFLGPFSSTGEFEISDNPAYGKGGALHEQLLVHKDTERKTFLLHTFSHWMASFLREDPLVYLPRAVGGLNVPWPHGFDELAELVADKVDPLIAKIYTTLSSEDDPPLVYHVLTRRMSTGASARGIIDPMTPMAVAQYAAIATSQFQDEAKTLDNFLAEVQSKKSYDCTHKDALRFARSSGYVSFGTIADNLDRMTAMRVSLAAAAGAFPLEEVLTVERERRPTPVEVLDQFIKVELPQSRRLYGIDPQDLKPDGDSVQKFTAWIKARAPNFISTMKKGWVPARAITDSLNGMTVKMPPPMGESIVMGSTADNFVQPQEGYSASVVSRKRLRST